MNEPARLVGQRIDQRRVAVPDLDDRHARQEVEVLVPLRIPEARALAAHELDGCARVRGHEVVARERLEVGEAHGKILVPMPASVKSSSSRLCGLRPSMMCAD